MKREPATRKKTFYGQKRKKLWIMMKQGSHEKLTREKGRVNIFF